MYIHTHIYIICACMFSCGSVSPTTCLQTYTLAELLGVQYVASLPLVQIISVDVMLIIVAL